MWNNLVQICKNLDSYNAALIVASCAHNGQLDKGGAPYILHPLTVANRLLDHNAKVVGLLHDVVEDSDITLENLQQLFNSEVCTAVSLLTKAHGVDYVDYINDISKNPLAKIVKISDLLHNMDVSRVHHSKVNDKFLKHRQKYMDAYNKLSSGIDYASMKQF